MQERHARPAGLRGRLGRMQSFVPPLLHVAVGKAEQSLSAVPARVVHSADGEIERRTQAQQPILILQKPIKYTTHSRFMMFIGYRVEFVFGVII